MYFKFFKNINGYFLDHFQSRRVILKQSINYFDRKPAVRLLFLTYFNVYEYFLIFFLNFKSIIKTFESLAVVFSKFKLEGIFINYL